MPFTDPMADGPSIQRAGQRALAAGHTMDRTLAMVRAFRDPDAETPLVLMGYYNPIYSRGVPRFLAEATRGRRRRADRRRPAARGGLRALPSGAGGGDDFIRLATPTTDDRRLPRVLTNTSGFLYYVSITGITGAGRGRRRRGRARGRPDQGATPLPVCVGFGIRTPEAAAAIAAIADGAVVGSAIVERIGAGESAESVLGFVRTLADAAHAA